MRFRKTLAVETVLGAGLAWGQANPVNPALPLSVPPSTQPAVTGTVRHVHSTGVPATDGATLQGVYSSTASCGDQIVLDAGATYTANFVFNKQCNSSNWIQLVSANLASIPVVTYATEAQANNQNSAPAAPTSANFSKLTSGNSSSPLVTSSDSPIVPGKYNYFGGLEVTNTVATALVVSGTGYLDETVVSQLPDHIIFDRLYVHGITASNTQFFLRGFLASGSNIAIVNTYVADIYSTSSDNQAILLAYGPGPYLIHNNFLEASSENVMAGGTGKTPGYSCTVASFPTTTTATVNTCIDAGSNSVSTPPVGTCVMFVTSATAPTYTPDDWTCITGNSGGVLTFPAIPSAPLSGAAKVKWGIVPSDITVTGNVFYKPPSWNPASSNYDGVSGGFCTVQSSPSPTTTSATMSACNFTNVTCASQSACASAGYGTWILYVGSTSYQTNLTSVNSSTGAFTFLAIASPPTSGSQALGGAYRDVKDLFETKYGARWLVNGNIFQHVWNGGQGGAVNINSNDQNGDCPWCVTSDITMTNNIWQDLYGGLGIIPAQSYSGNAPGPLQRVLFKNNLMWPTYSYGLWTFAGYILDGGAAPVGSLNGMDSLQIIHNHFLGPGTNIHAGGTIGEGIPQNYTNLVIKDNITEFDQYRWMNQCITGPDGTACINSSLNTGSTSTISNNAVINTGGVNGGQGVSDATLTTRYGSLILTAALVDSYTAADFTSLTAYNSLAGINTDYHNYALTGSSPFHHLASDGTDPGVNFAQLDAAFGVASTPTVTIRGASSVQGAGAIR